MYTIKSHYCQEGEQREILLAVSLVFAGFRKGFFYRKFPISTGRNAQLKQGKLLDLIWDNCTLADQLCVISLRN